MSAILQRHTKTISANKIVPDKRIPEQTCSRNAWFDDKSDLSPTICDNNLILDSQFSENIENAFVVNAISLDARENMLNANSSNENSDEIVQISSEKSENVGEHGEGNASDQCDRKSSENLSIISVHNSKENVNDTSEETRSETRSDAGDDLVISIEECFGKSSENISIDPSSVQVFSITIDEDKDKIDDALPCTKLLIENNSLKIVSGKLEDKLHSEKLRDSIGKKKRKKRKAKKKNECVDFLLFCECCPWTVPWIILIISSVQIIIYFLDNDFVYNLFIFAPMKMNELWRFITYTFLHAGSIHLSLNVLIQIMISFPLETEQGHFRVFLVYFGGVLSGSLGASIFERFLMVGASAGVYSLLMSHIPHIVINFSTLSHRYFRLGAVFILSSSDVIYSIKHCLTRGNSEPKIGVAAHASGAIAGIVLGFILYKSSSKLKIYKIIRFIALFLYTVWIATAILFNCKQNLFNL